MSRHLWQRVARLAITLLIVSFMTSLMLNLLPGDPAEQVANANFQVTPEEVEVVRHELDLDKSIPEQWASWTVSALQGDLGESYRSKQPALDMILERLPVTLELMIVAQILAVIFTLVVAPLSAASRGSRFDRITTAGTFAMLAIPNFIVGLLLIFLFAAKLQVLPATGFAPLSDGLVENLKSVILPATALAAPEAAVYTRLLRTEMIHTFEQNFITTARVKGISPWQVTFGHALRPSTLPLVTIMGLNVATLIGGAIITETLFAMPGVGRLAIDSILARDFVTVQAIVAFVTVAYVLVNFLVDVLYTVIDPRMRHVVH